MAADYEKLGLFYLGKRYDLAANARLADLILYDSRDLLTHAVVLGMTGSGKTGLGITILEEAAIDGVPVLAIDPKGDLTNLLLTFPNLAPSDFAPWVDPAEASRQQMSVDAYAADLATRWKTGLAEWDQDGSRIARLRAAADMRVYTPGSRAGTPLAILGQIGPTRHESAEDAQARITAMAAGLLGLVGTTDVQPHDREQALISAILQSRPTESDADLPWLVQQIQRPSFERVGVLDLETFYPARERQELALKFNSVLAAPGFELWSTGEPLQADSLLFTPEGRPRIAIISIAHLDDAQRMLVVSLTLNAVLQWTRRQTGTGSLRALVYMDEVAGYLPPVANPPSKGPLLTLLKQARAYGVGITLATQNPVDLDYKALSNIGTWFLGKLQTERDKARVLDGLETVAGGLDRQTVDRALSTLRGRVFLMHNVHESGPVAFETRWALSYLRGPMGRDELQRLHSPSRGRRPNGAPLAETPRRPNRRCRPECGRYFMKGMRDGRRHIVRCCTERRGFITPTRAEVWMSCAVSRPPSRLQKAPFPLTGSSATMASSRQTHSRTQKMPRVRPIGPLPERRSIQNTTLTGAVTSRIGFSVAAAQTVLVPALKLDLRTG